jgi:hypothetical protein
MIAETKHIWFDAGVAVGGGCVSIFLDDLIYVVVAAHRRRKGKPGNYPERAREKVIRDRLPSAVRSSEE